ncbi:radical SAM protein [bacterium]|nr:radical SAM protein [candidate division CSSED10-310 bacterium]
MTEEILNIHSIFTSIQGESTFAGLPFIFIRLAGCNLRCHWCDTKSAQTSLGSKQMSVTHIIQYTEKIGIHHVCVTGGEPLIQPNTILLVNRFCEKSGWIITLETNGSILMDQLHENVVCVMDIKCPSSGMENHNNFENLNIITSKDQIKFVIADRQDYEYAKMIFLKHLRMFQGAILFSPLWSKLDPAVLANWILSDKMPVRLHVQLHKYLDLQ